MEKGGLALAKSLSQTPTLYHYLASPYSEKLRLALGMAGMQWGSVIVSSQPPRPIVDFFLMGYRRIPVLQLGAHFYCDSKLAFDALAQYSDRLTWGGCLSASQELLRQRAEERVFFAVIAAASSISVLRFLARDLGLLGTLRFLQDRAQMMKDATIEKMSPSTAAGVIEDFVGHLESLLRFEDFLVGERASYLDLCCYHPLWMASLINRQAILSLPPLVQAWMQRIAALGHGASISLSQDQLHDMVITDTAPDPVGEISGSFAPGALVSVAPVDYARNRTVGHLAVMDSHQCVIKRGLQSGEAVFLHFPIAGFEVSPL